MQSAGLDWLTRLDRLLVPVRRAITEATAPDPARLGYPLFSARIKDRKRRWQVERQPNTYDAVASKLGGESFMRALGHPVPETYGIYPTLEDLPAFDKLPGAFVVKPALGWSSAGVYLIRDGVDIEGGRRLTREALIRETKSFRGPGWRGIGGPWIVEELLFDFDNRDRPASDYKIYCFGPKVVLVRVNRHSGLRKPKYLYWYQQPDWTRFPYQVNWEKYPERSVPDRPPFLDEMLAIASDAGRRLNIFVRVDMFASHRGPVFCEFTAHPSNGSFYTPRADAWLGSHWTTLEGGAEEPAGQSDGPSPELMSR
ncbi:MAG TPA: ATP-grasp fold amidoligase family protein [Tabrizicola sp.]|nr:ATP-grasp fold amidoligase family protein [Tabrizicola sp.]